MAIITAAMAQPTAIHSPPNTIHRRLSKREKTDMKSYAIRTDAAHLAAMTLRVEMDTRAIVR
jgi:hypothetical protein